MRAAVVLSPQVRPWHWVAAKAMQCWMAAFLVCLSITTAWSVNVHTYPSLAVPVTIPSNPNPPGSQMGTAQSSVVVSNFVGEILTVRVSLYITHSWPDDLQIILISPDNTQVILADNVGGNNRGPFGNAGTAPTTGFGIGNAEQPLGRVEFFQNTPIGIDDDDAVNPQGEPYAYILSGRYRPIAGQSLNNFTGKTGNQVNGTWRLVINDQAYADQGVLRSWTLEIEEATQHIWTGATNTDWNTPTNWLNNNIPNEIERNANIVFPDNATNKVSNRPTNGGIRIKSLQIAEGYTLSGQLFGMSDVSTIYTTAGSGGSSGLPITVQNGIELFGATTLSVIAGGPLTLSGAITGVGSLTKVGLGTAVLGGNNNNDYGGLTTVSNGILRVTKPAGLGAAGTAASATTVANGATLQITVGVANEWLTLVGTGTAGQGALHLDNAAPLNVNWTGPITLSALGSGVGANAGGALSLTNFAVTTGFRELIKVGAGDVILTAAVPATTNLTVNGGNLTTTTVAQPNVGILAVNGSTFTPASNVTVNTSISTTGTATLAAAAGTITLNGTRNMTVSNTVNVFSTIANGTLSVRGGTVNWQSNSPGGGLVMERGILTGVGTTANLTIGSAKMDATGVFSVANFTFGSNAWLAFRGVNTIRASGAVTLQGGVLQPFQNGLVIDLSPGQTNTGAFRFYPRGGPRVNYASGANANDVSFSAGGLATAFFSPTTSYTVAETDRSVTLTIRVQTGAMDFAITSAGGGLYPGGDFKELLLSGVAPGSVTPSLIINDDYMEEGTETGELIIVPLAGGLCIDPSSATLTILDNDEDDAKPCGFGTGLTVFLLLGFGLLLNARLRRH